MKKLSRFLLLYLPFFLYAGLIIYLSHQPHYPVKTPDVPYFDKLIHFAEYGIFGLLLSRIVAARASVGKFKIFFVTFIISVIFAFSDELHQLFIPGRSCDASDLLADLTGVMVVSGLYIYINNNNI